MITEAKEFKVIRSETNHEALQQKVNEVIKEGWLLLGQPYFSPAGNHFQAAVKYDESSTNYLDVSDYIVIRGDNVEKFCQEVREKISEGWVVSGNLIVKKYSVMYQRMVKFG